MKELNENLERCELYARLANESPDRHFWLVSAAAWRMRLQGHDARDARRAQKVAYFYAKH